jgi:hypothetical protein
MLGISFGLVQSILKDNLNMSDHAKFVPRLLSQEQKENHSANPRTFKGGWNEAHNSFLK